MAKPLVSWFVLWSVILGTLVLCACTPPKPSASEPTIEASPLGKEIGDWKVVASDALTAGRQLPLTDAVEPKPEA